MRSNRFPLAKNDSVAPRLEIRKASRRRVPLRLGEGHGCHRDLLNGKQQSSTVEVIVNQLRIYFQYFSVMWCTQESTIPNFTGNMVYNISKPSPNVEFCGIGFTTWSSIQWWFHLFLKDSVVPWSEVELQTPIGGWPSPIDDRWVRIPFF